MKSSFLSLLLICFSHLLFAVCEINFTPNANSDDGLIACENNSLPFMSGNGIDENILYVWDFGDGTTDSTYYTQAYGIHQYTTEGTYEVCLTEYYYVWGQFSCTASACQTIEVDISSFGCDEGETPLEVTITACCNFTDMQFVSYAIYSGTEVLPENYVYNGEIYLSPMPGEETNFHCLIPGCYVIHFNYVKMFETPENLEIYLSGNFSEEYQVLETFQGYPSLIAFCITEEDVLCPETNNIAIAHLSCNDLEFALDPLPEDAQVSWYVNGSAVTSEVISPFIYDFNEAGTYEVCATISSETCPETTERCTEVIIDSCIECDNETFPLYFDAYACCEVPELNGYGSDVEADVLDSEGNYVGWFPLVDNVDGVSGSFTNSICLAPGCYTLQIYYESMELIESTNYFTSFLFSSPYVTNLEIIEQYGNLPTVINLCIQPEAECVLQLTSMQTNANSFEFNAAGSVENEILYWSVNGIALENNSSFLAYSFENPGTYEVCCFIENVECGFMQNCLEIVVEEQLCPTEIIISDEINCHQFLLEVNNWGENPEGDITWSFGVGQSIGLNGVQHTFLEAGVYAVCVTGTTETCFDGFEICTELNVEACGGNTEGCPEYIWAMQAGNCGVWYFEAGIPSSNENATVIWDFGDGYSTTQFNTTANHYYAQPGFYNVTVNIQLYGNDCPATIILETGIVVDECEGGGCAFEVLVSQGETCGVAGLEALGLQGEQFMWDFGDGTSQAGGFFVEHQYTSPGIYTIECIITSSDCEGWQKITSVEIEDCSVLCTDVSVELTSDIPNGGPTIAYWSISDSNQSLISQGSAEFTEMNATFNNLTCLEDGCYTLTLEGIGVGNLLAVEIESYGTSLLQSIQVLNDNLIEYTFGVNSTCVENCSPSYVDVTLIQGNDPLAVSFYILETVNNTFVYSGGGQALVDFNYINNFCLPDGCYEIHFEFGSDNQMDIQYVANLIVNGEFIVVGENLLYFTANSYGFWFGVNSDCADGVSDEIAPEILIYPNPASDILYIGQSQSDRIQQVELWDGTGRLVLTKPFSNQIDVSELASGTYIVRVTSTEKTTVVPLQIHH